MGRLRASTITLVPLVADYGALVLPVALVAPWAGSRSTDQRQAVLIGCAAAVLAFCVGLVLERTSLGRAHSSNSASRRCCRMRPIPRFRAITR